jgi:hypothetical protein
MINFLIFIQKVLLLVGPKFIVLWLPRHDPFSHSQFGSVSTAENHFFDHSHPAGHNPLGFVRYFLLTLPMGSISKQGGQMINEVILEGIVVRDPWKFMDDLFFRLVIYRDSDLPAKKLDLERDAGDYINIRVNGGAKGLIHIRHGMRLRAHGFLQSRDFSESLEAFINKAQKSKNCTDLTVDIKACDLKQNQVFIDRSVVEAVARRIIVLDAATPNEKKARSIESVTIGKQAEAENDSSEMVSASGRCTCPCTNWRRL